MFVALGKALYQTELRRCRRRDSNPRPPA